MDFLVEYKNDLAFLLMRVVLGILFLMQGYDKVFGLGLQQTGRGIEEAMRRTRIPVFLVKIISVISSVVELAGGIMLIAGFLIYPALTLLGVDLLIVVFAMSLREPLWNMRDVWPRLVLLLALLLLPAAGDRLSLDHLFHFYENTASVTGN
jgi:putative oxidoreductase